jgi:hypothetical protein
MPAPLSDLTVHYYPGHFPPLRANLGPNHAAIGAGLLLVVRGSTVLFRGEAWGGPSAIVPIAGQPAMTPTPAGEYRLVDPEPYITPTWPNSRIKWGTPIKASPVDPTDVWYLQSVRQGRENWASMKRDFGMTRNEILDAHAEVTQKPTSQLPGQWMVNDFGPLAVRFYEDKNRNGRLDPPFEKLSGAMFHTTPQNEAETRAGVAPKMENSHGCIHLNPRDRDTLVGMKAFKAGVKLIIHTYAERYGT